MYENFDLDNLVTPANVEELEKLLQDSNYDQEKTKRLVEGFRFGFTLGYEGRQDVKITSPNLKVSIGDEIELWNKVMKEVKELRYAGPFEKIPFEDGYIQSPIGLVPKDNGTSTRLIFHLSYPRVGVTSVNHNTPRDTVQYLDIVKAIKLCLKEGRNCSCSKSDWKSAFRNFPILKKHWKFLVMKVRSPIDKKMVLFCRQMYAVWQLDQLCSFSGLL